MEWDAHRLLARESRTRRERQGPQNTTCLAHGSKAKDTRLATDFSHLRQNYKDRRDTEGEPAARDTTQRHDETASPASFAADRRGIGLAFAVEQSGSPYILFRSGFNANGRTGCDPGPNETGANGYTGTRDTVCRLATRRRRRNRSARGTDVRC